MVEKPSEIVPAVHVGEVEIIEIGLHVGGRDVTDRNVKGDGPAGPLDVDTLAGPLLAVATIADFLELLETVIAVIASPFPKPASRLVGIGVRRIAVSLLSGEFADLRRLRGREPLRRLAGDMLPAPLVTASGLA